MSPEIKVSTIVVSDLCCAAEELKIRKKLESLRGVHNLQFNVLSHKLTVQHSTSQEVILHALKEVGLPGYLEQRVRTADGQKTSRRQLYTVITSGALLLAGLATQFIHAPSLFSQSIFLAAIGIGGWHIALKAFKAVKAFSFDINFLMTIAVVGAVAIGQYAEGSAVIVLYALSLLLESMSIDRTRRAIHSLMRLSPATATVKQLAIEVIIPVEQVAIGETIVIRPGERIPLDGVVISGASSVDQSPITGESIPVSKRVADPVFAGSFNRRGALDVRVTKLTNDSTLARIIHLVEEAQAQRATSQTFMERFARSYTPSIFVLSILVAAVPPLVFAQPFADWFYRALVLLVISCPCALLISTPVTIVSAMTNAARNGLLIKGGKHLENLASLRAIAIDKTGTLTKGSLVVTEIVSLNSLSEAEIVRIAAALELKSEHHLAEALLSKAEQDGISLDGMAIDHFEAIHGKGVQALVNQKKFILGNHQLTEEMHVCSPAVEERLSELEKNGNTVVVLSDEKQALGLIAISDVVREESRYAVDQLHRLGIRPIVLLTGDNQTTATSIAKELGVDEIKAGLLPDQKLAAIHTLKVENGNIGMIGDGINDAPALASANVGIAMGGIGSDTAIQTADIVLMSDNLSRVPYGISLGRKALSVIKQNIVLALSAKAVFVLLGVFGLTSLWLAILADDGVTLAVVLNGMRLLRMKDMHHR